MQVPGGRQKAFTPRLSDGMSLDYTVPPAAPQGGFLLPTPAAQPYSCSAFFYKQLTFFFNGKPLLYREAAGLLPLHPVSPASCALACPAGSLLTPPFCIGSFGPMVGRAGGPLPAGPQALTSLSLLRVFVRWV